MLVSAKNAADEKFREEEGRKTKLGKNKQKSQKDRVCYEEEQDETRQRQKCSTACLLTDRLAGCELLPQVKTIIFNCTFEVAQRKAFFVAALFISGRKMQMRS